MKVTEMQGPKGRIKALHVLMPVEDKRNFKEWCVRNGITMEAQLLRMVRELVKTGRK